MSMFEFGAVAGGRSEAGSTGLSRGSACAGELATSSDRFDAVVMSSILNACLFDVCRSAELHCGVFIP